MPDSYRGEPRYYAFDLLCLNGIDLRSRPLLDRTRRLHRLIPANDSHLLYVEHLDGDGRRFFELVCEQDLRLNAPSSCAPSLAESLVETSTGAPYRKPSNRPQCKNLNNAL